MGKVVSLQEFRDSHGTPYLRGLVFEAWAHWLKGVNPLNGKATERKAWDKETSDKRESDRRKKDNEKTMKAYKIK